MHMAVSPILRHEESLNATAFGAPVVPLVYIRLAAADGSRSADSFTGSQRDARSAGQDTPLSALMIVSPGRSLSSGFG